MRLDLLLFREASNVVASSSRLPVPATQPRQAVATSESSIMSAVACSVALAGGASSVPTHSSAGANNGQVAEGEGM